MFTWIHWLTDFIPLNMYFTSCEMKQLNCKKFSWVNVGFSSSLSEHFISISNAPPKNWSINELKFRSKKRNYTEYFYIYFFQALNQLRRKYVIFTCNVAPIRPFATVSTFAVTFSTIPTNIHLHPIEHNQEKKIIEMNWICKINRNIAAPTRYLLSITALFTGLCELWKCHVQCLQQYNWRNCITAIQLIEYGSCGSRNRLWQCHCTDGKFLFELWQCFTQLGNGF